MRRLVLTLLVALTLAFLGLAAPASAAPTVVSFTINGSSAATQTVAPGSDLTIAWEVTGSGTVTVSGQGTGWTDTLEPSGTRTVDGPDAGKTLTYTLRSSDDTGSADDVTITVTAEDSSTTPPPAQDGATPPPVRVQGCTVTVPESDQFGYEIFLDGDPAGVLDPGQYTTGELTFSGNVSARVRAVPEKGVRVDPDATTEFAIPFDTSCQQTLFTVSPKPCAFTVTNVSGAPLAVLWGSSSAEEADGDVSLRAGGSRTISTSRERLLVVGFPDGDRADLQVKSLRIPQNGCTGSTAKGGVAWPIPVNAPAAGVTTSAPESRDVLWLPVGLLVATGLVGVAARIRATS